MKTNVKSSCCTPDKGKISNLCKIMWPHSFDFFYPSLTQPHIFATWLWKLFDVLNLFYLDYFMY